MKSQVTYVFHHDRSSAMDQHVTAREQITLQEPLTDDAYLAIFELDGKSLFRNCTTSQHPLNLRKNVALEIHVLTEAFSFCRKTSCS